MTTLSTKTDFQDRRVVMRIFQVAEELEYSHTTVHSYASVLENFSHHSKIDVLERLTAMVHRRMHFQGRTVAKVLRAEEIASSSITGKWHSIAQAIDQSSVQE